VEDDSTFAMLFAALTPLACLRPSSVPPPLPHSSSISRLVEINISLMPLSPPAIRSLIEGVQRGAPWSALATFTLTFCDFYCDYPNALSDIAILPLLHMFANAELTPSFHTLGYGFIHLPNDEEDVLKNLCFPFES